MHGIPAHSIKRLTIDTLSVERFLSTTRARQEDRGRSTTSLLSESWSKDLSYSITNLATQKHAKRSPDGLSQAS